MENIQFNGFARQLMAVIGLQFGDEGKGTIVEYLVRRFGARLVVRFNGGPQAAHHVVLSDGFKHCFSSFPSGMLVNGTMGLLSRHVLVDPNRMQNEAKELAHTHGVFNPMGRLMIDKRCVIITPWHQLICRVRELEKDEKDPQKRRGSTGVGVGEAQRMAQTFPEATIRAGDGALSKEQLFTKIRAHVKVATETLQTMTIKSVAAKRLINSHKVNDTELFLMMHWFSVHANLVDSSAIALLKAVRRGIRVVFEGAQGVLLDPVHGVSPHVTATRCDLTNVHTMLAEAKLDRKTLTTIGVVRTYSTRHGAGPFPADEYDEHKEFPLSELANSEQHNAQNVWQGKWRVGYADLGLWQRAKKACPHIDYLAVTHMDKLPLPIAAKDRFMMMSTPAAFVDAVEDYLGAPVAVQSFGPRFEDKISGSSAKTVYVLLGGQRCVGKDYIAVDIRTQIGKREFFLERGIRHVSIAHTMDGLKDEFARMIRATGTGADVDFMWSDRKQKEAYRTRFTAFVEAFMKNDTLFEAPFLALYSLCPSVVDRTLGSQIVIVTGVRHRQEVRWFRRKFGKERVVAIRVTAEEKTRAERGFEWSKAKDTHPTETALGQSEPIWDATVSNDVQGSCSGVPKTILPLIAMAITV